MNVSFRYLENKILPKSEFGRHFLTMLTGTSIAQAIPIAVSPILTRLYSPDDFGVFALYMALSSIIAMIATGRYELAIMLPHEEDDAFSIVILAVTIATAISGLLFVIVALFNHDIAIMLGNENVAPWLYAVPFTVLFIGVYQALYYWYNRNKKFKKLAGSRVTQTSVMAGTRVGMGAMGIGAFGLIFGQIMGQVASIFVLARSIFKENDVHLSKSSVKSVLDQAKKYVKFPKYSVAADSTNVLANQLPIILLTRFFGPAVVGFFSITQRVLAMPISIVAVSIGDVFKQKAAHDYKKYGNCRDIYIKTLKRLVITSAPPFFVLLLITPGLFEFVFGSEWRVAGQYAQIMVIMYFMRFVSSTLSYMFYLAEKQNYDLIWQATLLILSVASITLGYAMGKVEYSIGLFTATYTAMYIIYLGMSYKFAKGNAVGKSEKDETL